MAITYSDYTGDGVETDFAFSFPYLEDTHVVVEVDGVDKTTTAGDFTLPTTSLVRMTVGPADAAAVRVKRVSDFATDLVDFTNGSVLTEGDLDRAYQHNRYLNEEAAEGNDASMQIVGGGTDYNAANKKIVNLATPTASLDATNKNYVDTQVALSGTNLSGFESSAHTGDNTSVDFTLSFTPQVSTPEAFLVTIDGVVQKPTTAYTIDPDTPKITFTSAPPTSAVINVVAISKSSTSADTTMVKATGSTTSRTLANRFADVVNVLDYGADNTGATDNTNIIQSLIDSAQDGTGGRSIYFPAGEYYFEPQSGKINTCLQFAESDPTYQAQPEPIKIYGDGSNSRIVVNNVGANNVWMAGPDGSASECVSSVFVQDLNFCSSSASASDATDRTTYLNNYLTMSNYARIFNVGRMWRCEFRTLFFEYCNGFFTETSGEDSNNSFAQQITVDRCHSTQHQYYFIDLNQAWSCTFSNNTMESGNGCMKIGRSSSQSSYGVRIIGNTMQGNGTPYCGLRINYGSSLYIVGNYFESNRDSSGVATPHIFINDNTTESSIVLDSNFFSQSAANIDAYVTAVGSDYYHVRLDEVRNTVVFRGNTFTGGNGYSCAATSDGYLISLGDKFEATGASSTEGTIASGITFSDTIPIYKPATSWTPVISDASTGGNTATIGTINGVRYVRNGDLVTISAQMSNIDTTGMTGGNILYIQGLPFPASSEGLSQGSVVLEKVTFSGFVVPQIYYSQDVVQLRQSTSGLNDLSLTVGALASGTADIQFTVTYRI